MTTEQTLGEKMAVITSKLEDHDKAISEIRGQHIDMYKWVIGLVAVILIPIGVLLFNLQQTIGSVDTRVARLEVRFEERMDRFDERMGRIEVSLKDISDKLKEKP